MLNDNYKCDGQIELIDYLGQLEEETKKCLDCIYYNEFKCVRENCHKLCADDGWMPLWYDSRNHIFGNWPTCSEWLPVETVVEGMKIIVCDGKAKDKTFKWPKDTAKNFDDVVIAWRYKGEEA